MTKCIVITGASKGIGRAAAHVLVEDGWSVIGIARSSPQSFPGAFMEADLADQRSTLALANDLALAETCLELSTMSALPSMKRLALPGKRA